MRQLKITPQITNRETIALDKYYQEVAKLDLLNAEEEVELAHKIRQGDEQAFERLVKANLRFVISVAKHYQNQGLMLSDLIDEGNVGLIKAARRYDPTKGFKFISYAVWWIRQSIILALAEQSRMVRLPINRISILNKIHQASVKLEQEYEREPDISEIAELLHISETDIKASLSSAGRYVSMDAPVIYGDTSETNMHDKLQAKDSYGPDSNLLAESLKNTIERCLASLSKREAMILRLYYGLNNQHAMTLDEIGECVHLTRERVRQIKEKALRKLKHPSRNTPLLGYLADMEGFIS